MAIGNPVSYWYGTKAQYNALSLHLADTLYFITDEQTIYKGDVRFAEGVEQLSAVDSSAPSSPAKYDKYFDTDDGKIYVYDGTSWGNAYYPAEGNMYYDKNAKRFVYFVPTYDGTTVTGGSMADVYDAGVSGDANQGVSIQGTSTVTVANASINGKGVVKIGDNINVNNAGVISVSVANASTFGLVKTGDNITNTNGVISVGKATTSALGVVKVGTNIDVADGVISVKTGSTTDKGVVKVGTNIDVADGVISVKTATDENLGLVEISYTISDTDDDISTPRVPTVKTVNDALALKQDNLSNGNVTTLNTTDGAKIDVNVGDGLDVGVAGTTNANKLIVNEASVEEVLEDVVDGGTEPAVNEIVTADNLKGALSVGQAVDVSCAPACQGVVYDYSTDGTNWVPLGDFKATNGFLGDFYVRLVNGTAGSGAAYFGFHPSIPDGKFPKAAPGLKYLVVCDVCNMGAAIYNPAGFVVNGSSVISYSRVPEDARRAEQTTYTRVAGIMIDTGRAYFAFAPNAANTTIILHIKNWRQYEVTNLTDEAIQYLASATTNPNPDAFFRSTSAYSIRDKYLIKQDMVCPFIPTINMPDNSAGLTVGAGLSYKIKYTQTGTYSVSVDTIPTDAYGWDAHISMFVKDTAVVQFQAPLILMDALTPNAGHNLSVKFRNGNALVYVDDTNAGTMVYLTIGTTTTKGSLPYALSQTPPSEDATFTNFVVFSPVLGGTVCSMGTMSNVAYSASLIGNDDDSTIVGGTIGLASGKYLAVQDINLNDVEITSGTLNIGNNIKVTGTTTNGVVGTGTGAIVLDNGCLLDFSDQTNNVPITGASISAVSGARAIPYGETESEAIVAGTGNAVNKYGKCGYLVSDASGTTASNTFYDALVGGGTAYSNVIFNPALDGSTVSVLGGIYSTSSTSTYYMPSGRDIYGNGQEDTILTLDPSSPKTYFRAEKPIKFFDSNIDVVTRVSPGTYVNCKFTNVRDIYSGDIGALCIGSNSGQTTTITDCTVSDILDSTTNNRCLFSINANSKLEATNVRITGCTVYRGIVLSGTTSYFGNSVLDRIVFDGNLFGVGTGGAVCASYGSSTWGVFKATIKDCSFLDTTAAIRVGGAESVVTFAGTNVINSTVSGAGTVAFADGATVTSIIPEGSTIGTGVISCRMSELTTGCMLENVTITGVTTSGSDLIKLQDGAGKVTLKNLLITGNTPSNYTPFVRTASVTDSVDIVGCTFTNTNSTFTSLYCAIGYMYIKDTTLAVSLYIGNQNSTMVIDGTVTANTMRGIEVYDGGGRVVFKPDSKIILNSAFSPAAGKEYILGVGTYEDGVFTETGTATAVIGGTTVSISGSGHYLDTDGIHN